jgi:putative spermidine/putrescine transport system permease protein
MATYRPGWAAVLLVALAVVFLLAPLVAVVPFSFTPTRFLSLPSGEWSARHYRTLIEVRAWRDAGLFSLSVGVAASLVATTLATLFSVGIWLVQPRFTTLLVGFVLLPMIVPPVVSAVTLYFLLTSLSRVSTAIGYDTWPGVVLAHVVMIAPFAVVLVLVALARVDRRIDMAARGMGASLATRVVEVILPNIRFGVLSALFLTFVLSWEEIAVTLFVTSVRAITLPRLVWIGLRDNVDPAVAAVSVVLIVVAVGVVTAIVVGRRVARR